MARNNDNNNSNGDEMGDDLNTQDFDQDGTEIEIVSDEDTATGEAQSSGTSEDAEKFKNDYLYLRAEFENYKKQMIKERSDLVKYGSERLVREILGVLDIFTQALNMEVNNENLDSFKQGMEMTYAELMSALARVGLSESDPLGQPFDPTLHEALSSEETDKYPEGHISNVYKKAFLLHDRVIRPAQVIVAKKPSALADEDFDENEE